MAFKRKVTLGTLTTIITVATPMVALISCSKKSHNLQELKRAMSEGGAAREIKTVDGTIVPTGVVQNLVKEIENTINRSRPAFTFLKSQVINGYRSAISAKAFVVSQQQIDGKYKESSKISVKSKWEKEYYKFENKFNNEHKFKEAIKILQDYFQTFKDAYDNENNGGPLFSPSQIMNISDQDIRAANAELKKGWHATFNSASVSGLKPYYSKLKSTIYSYIHSKGFKVTMK